MNPVNPTNVANIAKSAQPQMPKELEQLRDIYMPADPSWWPLAPGWWVLIGLIVLLGLYLGFKNYQHKQHLRWQQRVLNEVDKAIEGQSDRNLQLANISEVLRRVALQRYPNDKVVTLQGEKWLAFLDRTGGDGAFSREEAKQLADAVYRPPQQAGPLTQADDLVKAVRRWIKRNI